MDLDSRREITAQAGAINAMIELDVLTGVKVLVKQAHALEDRTAVSNSHALGRDKLLLRRINERARVMTKPARTAARNGALQGRGMGDVERLRAAQAIGAGPLQSVCDVQQVIGIVQLAMTV